MTDPRRDDPLAEARRPERVDLDVIETLGEYVSDCRWSAAFGVVRGLDDAAFPEIATVIREGDAEWIAFFDPPTVRKVVDELRATRRAHDALAEFLAAYERGHRHTLKVRRELRRSLNGASA